MRKGALSIEVVIVLVLCVLVLAAIVGFFLGVFKPTSSSTTIDIAKLNACRQLISAGCASGGDAGLIQINNYDADNDGKLDPGYQICYTGSAGTLTGCWDCHLTGDCNPYYKGDYPTYGNDNLFMLCVTKYGCHPLQDGSHNLRVDYAQGKESSFYDCCFKKVCGCP